MKRSLRGFTLVELLVTLTILVIGLMIAVPSMIGFQRSAELTAASNTLTSAINAARSEAMKRNVFAAVAPVSGTAWGSGYVVFVDMDRDGTNSAGDIIVTQQPAAPANLEVLARNAAGTALSSISFDGSGFTRAAGAGLVVTIRRLDTKGKAEEYTNTRHVMITQTGRVRTCKPASAADANCNPDAP